MKIGHIVIEPKPTIVQPTSIDLHLDGELIDDREESITLSDVETYEMAPGDFLLAATAEYVSIASNQLVGVLMGKSTLARLGLQVEAAGYVDPGWKGQLTLELKNLHTRNPIYLRKGMKICQIRFERLSSPATQTYGNPNLRSHYQGSVGPVAGDGRGLFDPLDRSDPSPE